MFFAIIFTGFLIISVRPLFGQETRKKVFLLVASTLFTLLVCEGLLRISKITQNATELRLGHYVFVNHHSYRDTLHVWPANERHEIGDGVQFLYPRQTNSLGLSDREWQKDKPDSVFRIVALGDSFTEGDGAPSDSAWPRLMEQDIIREGRVTEVLNAGVCGSDPYFELMLFDKELYAYSPDIAIFTIALQDIKEDIAVRGGLGRFDPKNDKLPRLMEQVYAYSHIARLFYNRVLGYSWQLVRHDQEFYDAMINERLPEMFGFFKEIQDKHPQTKFILVYYPHLVNVTWELTSLESNKLEHAILNIAESNGITVVSLKECYQQEIEKSGLPAEHFWWKYDGHHNPSGYLMMAKCMKQQLGL